MNKSTAVRSSRFLQIVKSYKSWFAVYFPGQDFSSIEPFLMRVHNSLINRGPLATIEWIKSTRLAYTKWLAEDSRPDVNVKLDASGLPVMVKSTLGPFIKDAKGKAIIMTLLNCIRSFEGLQNPSVDDITSPYKGERWIDSYLELYMPEFVRKYGGLRNDRPQFKQWLYTTKRGPNGPSMATAYHDLDLVTKSISNDYAVLAGEAYRDKLEEISKLKSDPKTWSDISRDFALAVDVKSQLTDKISVIPSPEGKTRTISMSSYWAQNALHPLHSMVFRCLRRLPNDLTFNQARGLSCLMKTQEHSYWSFDLKAATDRFPRSTQALILSYLVDKEFSDSWSTLMSAEHYIPFMKHNASWQVGQPIGKLSSWAVFTYTHHFVIFVAHRRANVPFAAGTYVILGDDVVIANDAVAEQYSLLINWLGVDISMNKTHRSAHSFEIGKRWIHRGEEISPFSIVPWMQAKNWATAITQCVFEESKRNWSVSDISGAVHSAILFITPHEKTARLNDHLSKLAKINVAIREAISSLTTWSECIDKVAEVLRGTEWFASTKEEGDCLKRVIYLRLFNQNAKPHWQSIRDVTIKVTDFSRESMIAMIIGGLSLSGAAFSYSDLPHKKILRRFSQAFFDKNSEVTSGSDMWDTDNEREAVRSLGIPNIKHAFTKSAVRRDVILTNSVLKEVCGFVKSVPASGLSYSPGSKISVEIEAFKKKVENYG